MVVETLGGANLIHDLSYLESGLCGSLAQLVICNEMVSWIEKMISPIEISDETLALDLIDEVGPDGSFLDSDHTMNHFRDRWYPEIFERGNFDQWLEAGGLSLGERAAQQVDTILEEHRPESLPEDIQQKIKAIVQRAEESFA